MRFFTLRARGGNFTVFLVILFVAIAAGTFAFLQHTGRLADYKINMFSGIVTDNTLPEEIPDEEEENGLSIGLTEPDIVQQEEQVQEQGQTFILPSGAKEYKETAENGDGVTNLARRAVKEYLEENSTDSDLTPEHKIFVEDYVQNHIGDKGLAVGETITISEDLIAEAINQSQDLSAGELENLENFSELVWTPGF